MASTTERTALLFRAVRYPILAGFLIVAGAVLVAACSDQVLEPDSVIVRDNPLLKKGGGGKPGGGGGATAPDPVITFVGSKGALWVMNKDGSNRTKIFANDWVSAPSWAPFGEGTLTEPYQIIFWGNGSKISYTVDIDTVGGTVNARNIDPFQFNPAAGLLWGPGTGTEMAYIGGEINPMTGDRDDVLYVASDVTLPDPTPTAVYRPPPGHRLAYPTWSPTGDAIAFREYFEVIEGGSIHSLDALKVLNQNTGVVTTLWDFGEFGGERQIDWSRTISNPRLAVPVEVPKKRGSTTQLYIVELSVNAAGNFVRAGESLLLTGSNWPTWSPDDTQLAVTGGGYVRIVDVATGSAENVARGEWSPDWRR